MDPDDGTTRRTLIKAGACIAGITMMPRASALSLARQRGGLDSQVALPAMPQQLPLNWDQRADEFDRFVMSPTNRVLRTRSDGSRYFASALEGTGDGGLTTFAPILLGKILRGETVDWLAPSLAAYFSEKYGIFLDGVRASACEYWYLMNVNALAAGIVLRLWSLDQQWMARVRSSADRLIAIAHQVEYNFNDQGYQFDARKPWTKQEIYRQPDTVGGYAYLQLLAYRMFGDAKYLAEAKTGLRRYLSFTKNPWYEVPSGAMACLAAAHLSVTDSTIDVGKALRFVLNPGGRPMQTGSWGSHEVDGLMAGFCTEPLGEAYSMESLVTAGYLLPVLRYRPEFAELIGRYLLNVSANMRLFYSDCIPAENQSRPDLTSAIPYERLTHTLNGRSPYASGDYGSHRSIYGGAYALWWGELISATTDPRILGMSIARTDFLEPHGYPTYLYYNPLAVARMIRVAPAPRGSRLYDLTTHVFLPMANQADPSVEIPPRGARVIVVVPPDARLELKEGALFCGNIAVDYATTSSLRF